MRILPALLLLVTACAHGRPSEDTPAQRFVGYYEAEWERQVFRPCDTPESWWAWNTGLIEREPAGAPGRFFVVLEGQVSPPGRYGHMGRYPRQILITKVLEVRPAERTSCTSTV